MQIYAYTYIIFQNQGSSFCDSSKKKQQQQQVQQQPTITGSGSTAAAAPTASAPSTTAVGVGGAASSLEQKLDILIAEVQVLRLERKRENDRRLLS